MEENDKQERYQEYKRKKTQIFVEEENKHKTETEKIEKENRKETIEAMIFFIVLSIPVLIFIIVQWCNLVISLFNIVPFVIVVFIIVGNIKNLTNPKTEPRTPIFSQIKTDEAPSYLESQDKNKISNANLGSKTNQTKYSIAQKIVTKIVGCVLSLAFVVAGLVFYSRMVAKYKGDEYTIVNAEVVKVVDRTTTTGHYDGDEYVTETDDKCIVTFRYFDGTETVEVKKSFKNTSYIKEKTMKIILRDGKVVATENKMIAGRFLSIYSIVAGILTLINAITGSERETLIILIIGSIFLGAGMSVGLSLQISNSALIHSSWIAVPIMLATVAFYFHIYLIYRTIKEKIAQKKAITTR